MSKRPREYRDPRDPDNRRNPRLYAPSDPFFPSSDYRRRYNPQEHMGRGLRNARSRYPAWRENGRYYARYPSGRQDLGTRRPDWRYYAVHYDGYQP